MTIAAGAVLVLCLLCVLQVHSAVTLVSSTSTSAASKSLCDAALEEVQNHYDQRGGGEAAVADLIKDAVMERCGASSEPPAVKQPRQPETPPSRERATLGDEISARLHAQQQRDYLRQRRDHSNATDEDINTLLSPLFDCQNANTDEIDAIITFRCTIALHGQPCSTVAEDANGRALAAETLAEDARVRHRLRIVVPIDDRGDINLDDSMFLDLLQSIDGTLDRIVINSVKPSTNAGNVIGYLKNIVTKLANYDRIFHTTVAVEVIEGMIDVKQDTFAWISNLHELTFTSLAEITFASDWGHAAPDLTRLSFEEVRKEANYHGAVESTPMLTILSFEDVRFHQHRLPSFALEHLQALHVRRTNLQSLSRDQFLGLPQLIFLDLFDNQISHTHGASLRGLDNLLILQAHRNKLTGAFYEALAQGDLASLAFLWLSENNFGSIGAASFSALPQLRFLILNSCQLTQIHPSAFKNHRHLERISLSSNRLTSLPTALFVSEALVDVSIEENPSLQFSFELFKGSAASLNFIRVYDVERVDLGACALPQEQGGQPQASSCPGFPALKGIRFARIGSVMTTKGGTIEHFFARFTNLSGAAIGWKSLSDETYNLHRLCDSFNASSTHQGGIFAVLDTSYTNITVCSNLTFPRVQIRDNLRLTSVALVSTNLLNLDGNPNLRSLAVAEAEAVDISGTNLPLIQELCDTVGSKVLFARNLRNANIVAKDAKQHIIRFLRRCIATVDILDISDNEWVNLDVITQGATATFIYETISDLQNLDPQEVVTHDTAESIAVRKTLPQLFLTETPVACTLELESRLFFDRCKGRSPVARAITFKHDCRCASSYERRGRDCVRSGLSAGEISAITIGVIIVLAIITVIVVRKRLNRFRKNQLELTELNTLQEKLLNTRDEEVLALKNAWRISNSELSLIKVIGEGSFSNVWHANWDGIQVAVKFLKQAVLDDATLGTFDTEMDFLRRTRHPNLVRFFGAGVKDDGVPFIVLEYVQYGSLYAMLHTKGLGYYFTAYAEANKNRRPTLGEWDVVQTDGDFEEADADYLNQYDNDSEFYNDIYKNTLMAEDGLLQREHAALVASGPTTTVRDVDHDESFVDDAAAPLLASSLSASLPHKLTVKGKSGKRTKKKAGGPPSMRRGSMRKRSVVNPSARSTDHEATVFSSALDMRLSIMRDVACGMSFIHSKRLFHRDLKSGNVLVTDKFRAKLTDFGSIKARFRPHTRQATTNSNSNPSAHSISGSKNEDSLMSAQSLLSTNAFSVFDAFSLDGSLSQARDLSLAQLTSTVGVGTPLYMAPELLQRTPAITASSDVFSFGVMLWEVMTERTPDLVFQEYGSKFKGNYLVCLRKLYDAGKTLHLNAEVVKEEALPSWYEGLMDRCMSITPRDRPKFLAILEIFHREGFNTMLAPTLVDDGTHTSHTSL